MERGRNHSSRVSLLFSGYADERRSKLWAVSRIGLLVSTGETKHIKICCFLVRNVSSHHVFIGSPTRSGKKHAKPTSEGDHVTDLKENNMLKRNPTASWFPLDQWNHSEGIWVISDLNYIMNQMYLVIYAFQLRTKTSGWILLFKRDSEAGKERTTTTKNNDNITTMQLANIMEGCFALGIWELAINDGYVLYDDSFVAE